MATLFGDVGQEEEPRFVQPLLGSAVFLSNLDRLGNFQRLNQSMGVSLNDGIPKTSQNDHF